MKKLELLALSDTHLGESTSILTTAEGRQHLWKTLREHFEAEDDRVAVGELILLGDIADLALASKDQVEAGCAALMRTLGSILDVGRVIYVPGNHDHTLWSRYAAAAGRPRGAGTSLRGEVIVKDGAPVAGTAAHVAELLRLLFGWPDGSAWRAIEGDGKLDVVLANPAYARSFGQRTYLFAHGTHFRRDVTLPGWIKELGDHLQIDRLLGGIELETGGDPATANDLLELERVVTPFVDTLWGNQGDDATSRSDELWYLLTELSSKFRKTRATPPASRRFTLAELEANAAAGRVGRLDGRSASLERCSARFVPCATRQLRDEDLGERPTTFVYGDTHDGGFGVLPVPGAEPWRVYNTGAWVVLGRESHPPCHLFAVDEDGGEHLLDVSFEGVRRGSRPLLEVAAEQAEHRIGRVPRHFRFAARVLAGRQG